MTGRAVIDGAREGIRGPSHSSAEGAEGRSESVFGRGSLRLLTSTWEDIQKTRLAAEQRGQSDLAAILKKQEERYGRMIRRELEKHPIWPWLSQFPGLGGVHTARLLGYIGEPRRFPGQRCDKGHYSAPLYDVASVCPVVTIDGPCDGVMLPPRPHTGTRSLWHWAGLTPGARRKKGQQADYNPKVKTLFLMPGGIAEQIVRLKVPHYRDIYDATKERLQRERAVDTAESGGRFGPIPEGVFAEVAARLGAIPIQAAGADAGDVTEPPDGLRPFQIDAIARKVAAKAFAGDLLAEWKRVVAEKRPESGSSNGDGALPKESAA